MSSWPAAVHRAFGRPIDRGKAGTFRRKAADHRSIARGEEERLVFIGERSGLPATASKEKILAFPGMMAYVPSEQTPNTSPEATPMSLANFPAVVLETILTRLAALFLIGANGDATAARQAAFQVLAAYHPETQDELSLAAQVIAFSFQALEALGQAAEPDLPVTRVLRLRSGAVSLSRESAKAQRRLIQLQKDRHQGAQAEPARQPDKPLGLVKNTGPVATAAKVGGLTWTQAYEQRQRDTRIAASLKRAEALVAAKTVPVPPGPQQPAIVQAV
jgi:hypothetical protein